MRQEQKIPPIFFILVGSVFVSQLGLSVYITALNWRVLEFSNSAYYTGVIATSITLPQFFFSLAGGNLADNYEKLRSLRMIILAQVVVALLFSLVSSRVPFNFVVTYAISALLGILGAIWQPIYLSYLPNLVQKSYVPLGMSVSLAGLYASRFLGPVLSAWLLKHFASSTAFYVYFFSLLLPLLVLCFFKLPTFAVTASTSKDKRTFSLSILLQERAIFSLWLINAAVSFFIMSFFSIIPYFAKNIFGLDSSGMGQLMSSCGLGQLIGAGISMLTGRRNETKFGVNQYIGYVLMGIFILVFSLSRNVVLAILALLLMNLLHGVLSPRANAVIQTYVPEHMRGRVQSMFLLVFGLVPFGQFILGLITPDKAPRLGAIVYMVLFLMTLLIVLLKFNALFKFQQLNGCIVLSEDDKTEKIVG